MTPPGAAQAQGHGVLALQPRGQVRQPNRGPAGGVREQVRLLGFN